MHPCRRGPACAAVTTQAAQVRAGRPPASPRRSARRRRWTAARPPNRRARQRARRRRAPARRRSLRGAPAGPRGAPRGWAAPAAARRGRPARPRAQAWGRYPRRQTAEAAAAGPTQPVPDGGRVRARRARPLLTPATSRRLVYNRGGPSCCVYVKSVTVCRCSKIRTHTRAEAASSTSSCTACQNPRHHACQNRLQQTLSGAHGAVRTCFPAQTFASHEPWASAAERAC